MQLNNIILFLLAAMPLLAVVVVAQSGNDCRDDPNFTWSYTWNGIRYSQSCSFLTDAVDPERNEIRQQNHCGKTGRGGILVRNACRQSCNNCSGVRPPPPDNPPNPILPGKCHNYPGWMEDTGDRKCWFYKNNEGACLDMDYRPGTDGKTRTEACCVCGGGCFDFKDFQDNRGLGCESYPGGWGAADACRFAALYRNDANIDAREACCACGGGMFPTTLLAEA